MAEVTPADVRNEILAGSFGCVREIGLIAVDNEYLGFEDPRSAANYVLGKNWADCPVNGCSKSVKVTDHSETLLEKGGECRAEDVCLSVAWDQAAGSIDGLEAAGTRRASSEVLSYRCVHLGCGFNCGFTIDGNTGSAGYCRENAEHANVDENKTTLQ